MAELFDCRPREVPIAVVELEDDEPGDKAEQAEMLRLKGEVLLMRGLSATQGFEVVDV